MNDDIGLKMTSFDNLKSQMVLGKTVMVAVMIVLFVGIMAV